MLRELQRQPPLQPRPNMTRAGRTASGTQVRVKMQLMPKAVVQVVQVGRYRYFYSDC